MERLQYLAAPEVLGFTRYLRSLLIERDGPVLSIGKGSRRRPIRSLYDAQLAFRWRGRDFCQVNRDLEAFRNELHEALAACAPGRPGCRPALAQYELLYACTKILVWANLSKDALPYVTDRAQSAELSACLVRAAAVIDGECDDTGAFDGDDLRHGPGMARLYAAMNDRTIAYNARVSAALCLLCHHYSVGHGTIPELIRFRLTTTNPRHDPSRIQALRFRRVSSDVDHARWNIRANWIVDVLASDPAVAEHLGGGRRERIRRIEAALFMIGDDVRTRPLKTARAIRTAPLALPNCAGTDRRTDVRSAGRDGW